MPTCSRALQICGGNRVPVLVFFTRGWLRGGPRRDRTLAKYRAMMQEKPGRVPYSGRPSARIRCRPGDARLAQEFERVQWMLAFCTLAEDSQRLTNPHQRRSLVGVEAGSTPANRWRSARGAWRKTPCRTSSSLLPLHPAMLHAQDIPKYAPPAEVRASSQEIARSAQGAARCQSRSQPKTRATAASRASQLRHRRRKPTATSNACR